MDLQFLRVGLTMEPSVGATMVARAHIVKREWQTGRGRLGEEKQQSNLVLGPTPAARKKKKKKLEVMANTCYFQFQELISESKGVATRWVYAGDGLYFCILVAVLSFLQAWLLSLWDCNLSHLPVHPLQVTAVADYLGNYTRLQNIMARSIGKWSTPNRDSFRQGKSHLNPLQH